MALPHKAALVMATSGFVAVLAGWITTEVGRQPYVIYGLVLSAAAASPLDAPAPASSLLAFIIVYFMAFVSGTLFPIFDVWREHDRAMNSVAPVWDGNDTWLVLRSGGLFAAFPLAYAAVLPATSPLIIACRGAFCSGASRLNIAGVIRSTGVSGMQPLRAALWSLPWRSA